MATIEQEKEQRRSLNSILNDISKINLDDLLREDLGRELNFLDGRSYFERSLQIFCELTAVDLAALSYSAGIRGQRAYCGILGSDSGC